VLTWAFGGSGKTGRPTSIPFARRYVNLHRICAESTPTTNNNVPMKVMALWRYPVKSMQGESLAKSVVGPAGLFGDRRHALRDAATGVVLTARRDPELLFARGHLDGEDATVALPDGSVSADDTVLSQWLGRPVELIGPSGEANTYENIADPEDDESDVVAWEGPVWSFHDSSRTQVSIVGTGDLADWDVRRFRPNLVVDTATADVLVGRRLRIGSAELDVVKHIDRCVITTRPQPDGIERDLDVLRTIRRERDLCLGVGAMVRVQGEIAVGDTVEILDDV